MDNREKAVVMAYTGIAMLAGKDFDVFHKYVQEILGRLVWAHELADYKVQEQIKEASKADFLKLCESPRVMSLEEAQKWADTPLEYRDPVFYEDRILERAWWVLDSDVRNYLMAIKSGDGRFWTSRPTNGQMEAAPWD